MQAAIAHMQQLLALGADYVTAVKDTVVAYEIDQFELQEAWHNAVHRNTI
jgi:hypothetical protein